MQATTQTCFRALADPTRRDIIRLLAHSDMSIGQLTSRFDMTRATVKKHLMILSDGRLISVEPRGRERINHLEPAGLAPVLRWLKFFNAFWDDKLATWLHKPTAPLITGAALAMHGTKSGDLLIWGEVKQARAPEYLEYTFTVKPMGEAVNLVKWTLTPVERGTRLSLEHSGLPAGAEAFGLLLALDDGWDGHISRMRKDINKINS